MFSFPQGRIPLVLDKENENLIDWNVLLTETFIVARVESKSLMCTSFLLQQCFLQGQVVQKPFPRIKCYLQHYFLLLLFKNDFRL